MRKGNEKTKEKNKTKREKNILGCHNEDRASSISEISLLFSSQINSVLFHGNLLFTIR